MKKTSNLESIEKVLDRQIVLVQDLVYHYQIHS